MAEPAELLLIKDQYELAFHSLSRGLAAEEAGHRDAALDYYRKGHQLLTRGAEMPTGGPRQLGAAWDTARQLQQRMRDTLRAVSTHISDLETSQLTPGNQGVPLMMNLPPNLYPDLAAVNQPPHSTLHHLYPTIDTTTQCTKPTSNTASPAAAAPHTQMLPAAAPGTIAMASPGDQPPAYTPQPTDGHRSLSYGLAGGGLGAGKQTGAAAGGNGKELLLIPSGVQMFFVAPNGQVSSLSYPGFLRIIVFDSQCKDPAAAGRPSAFLHVCDWLYPLTTDTPVLLANSGIFMFPDTLAETPGSYVGIVLSSELPVADRVMFQDLILQLAELRIQGSEGAGSEVINLSEKVALGLPKEETGMTGATGEDKEKLPLPGWSEKMAHGILSGATRLSQGFAKGAEVTGRVIHKGASKMRDHISPEETPSEVSPRVTKGLQAAKQASGGAVRVSQFLVNGVSMVAGHVAEKLGPHVKKHGAKLIPESMKTSKDGHASNLDGAKYVAASSVQGFTTVWSSLETGAKVVCKSVAAETVTTVKHKYGDDAGQATDTALQTAANVGVTAMTIDGFASEVFLTTVSKVANKQAAETQGKEPQKQEHHTETERKNVQGKEEEEENK